MNASRFPRWGGNWSNSDNAGPFYWNFNGSATDTNSIIKAVKHSEPVDAHMMDSEQSRRSMAEWCDSKHLLKLHFGRMDRALAIGPEAI